MVFYLVGTLIWLGAALVMLLWPGNQPTTFAGFNPGWVALALAGYNLVRCLSVWMLRSSRQARTAEAPRALERSSPTPPREPNPAFDFRSEPPVVPDGPNSRRDTSV